MFNYPRYTKEDYEKAKVILYCRSLDGIVTRMEIPGTGNNVTDMLEHFRMFMAGMGYMVDGEFVYNSAEEMREEEAARQSFKDKMDQEDYEQLLEQDKKAVEQAKSCCPHENVVFGRVRDSI